MRGAAGPVREALTGVLADGSAIIETAEIVGITDPVGMGVPVQARNTRGMGEAIRALLDAACGGFSSRSAAAARTTAARVCWRVSASSYSTRKDRELEPTPEQLARVARVDVSQLDARLADTQFIGMSDVDNPLTGEHGATAVFGPQKGVEPEQVATIDAALARFADLLEAALGRTRAQPARRGRGRRTRLRAAHARRAVRAGRGSGRAADRPRRGARRARTG